MTKLLMLVRLSSLSLVMELTWIRLSVAAGKSVPKSLDQDTFGSGTPLAAHFKAAVDPPVVK